MEGSTLIRGASGRSLRIWGDGRRHDCGRVYTTICRISAGAKRWFPSVPVGMKSPDRNGSACWTKKARQRCRRARRCVKNPAVHPGAGVNTACGLSAVSAAVSRPRPKAAGAAATGRTVGEGQPARRSDDVGAGSGGQRCSCASTLTGINISVDLYIDMQVIFSLFEVIYNNYRTQRIQFQFDKIASIQYSILLLLFMIT